jgi:flagellar basal-body rod modification protein FlgD
MIGDVTTTTAPKSSVTANAPGGKMGKDEFLKLLVAQLKNQDPMNPSNGQEMAAQLAQFSSLEQLTQIGTSLETQGGYMQGVIGSLAASGAMGAVGKPVVAYGDHVAVPADESVRFAVGGGGGSATLRIFDAAGKEISSRDLGTLKAGEQSAELGTLTAGLPEGWYRYSVEVVDATGKEVPCVTYTAATIDGVRYTPEGPLLTAGELTIPYEALVEIGRSVAPLTR